MKKVIFLILISMTAYSVFSQENIDFPGIKISAYIVAQLNEKMEKLKTGESMFISTDNYQALRTDILSWGNLTGNKVIITEQSEKLLFEITKLTDQKPNGKSVAMIISDKGLEELLSPLGFSLTSALCGYQVNIYFQGPAVKVLEKGFKEKLKGFNKPFSIFARKGLVRIGHSPAQEKLRMLERYGAKFYVCQPSMDHFGAKAEKFIFSNIEICEYFTFLDVIEKSEISYFLQ